MIIYKHIIPNENIFVLLISNLLTNLLFVLLSYIININSGDYGLQFEKNAYIDNMKQDYKLTLSKRF